MPVPFAAFAQTAYAQDAATAPTPSADTQETQVASADQPAPISGVTPASPEAPPELLGDALEARAAAGSLRAGDFFGTSMATF